MTPRCFPLASSDSTKTPRLGGTPGSSRVRSELTICQLLPPLVVLNSTLDAKYKMWGSTGENIRGCVRLKRYWPVRSTTGETSWVCDVVRLNLVTLPP